MASFFQGLGSLCSADREIFNRFGRGPHIEPIFSLVHEAFESIADRQPSSTAAEHNGAAISYHELERLSNILANHLIINGLKPRQRVCLVLQRSIDMVIAIIAVLKCGCQYVPLDGGVVPDNVLSHIFKDTQAQYILCLNKFHDRVHKFASSTSAIVVLDAPNNGGRSQTLTKRPAVRVVSSDGLYIIYTSGSTQNPLRVNILTL